MNMIHFCTKEGFNAPQQSNNSKLKSKLTIFMNPKIPVMALGQAQPVTTRRYEKIKFTCQCAVGYQIHQLLQTAANRCRLWIRMGRCLQLQWAWSSQQYSHSRAAGWCSAGAFEGHRQEYHMQWHIWWHNGAREVVKFVTYHVKEEWLPSQKKKRGHDDIDHPPVTVNNSVDQLAFKCQLQ